MPALESRDVNSLLSDAIAHLRQGRHGDARELAVRILITHPEAPGALHVLGLALLLDGDAEAAVGPLARAARASPKDVELLCHLAAAQLQSGDAEAAAATCAKALKRDKGSATAHATLGTALAALDRLDEAVRSFRTALRIEPKDGKARFNLGNALRRLGRFAEARKSYEAALALLPGHAAAHNNCGIACRALGDRDRARAHYEAALAADPGFADAHANLADLAEEDGDGAAALAHRAEVARLRPDDWRAHNALGASLAGQGRTNEAVDAFRAALVRDPTAADACNNLGNALAAAHRPGEAVELFERALRLAPGDAETLANLGHALRQDGRETEAIAAYDRAVAAAPDGIEGRFGHAVVLLTLGRFREGFDDYRWRESMAGCGAPFVRSALPDDLSGQRLVFLQDQGIGDEIFFLRYAPALRARGAELVYHADPRLAAMLGRAGIADAVEAAASDAAPPGPVHSIGDLPCLLGASDDDAPPPFAIPPLDDRIARMGKLLHGLGAPPYVGVTWRAGTLRVKRLLFKETPHTELARALAGCDATFVALQRAPRPGEIDAFAAALGRNLHDLSALNDDLESMLAVLALLDEHVCVSNTNVHLRAAAGRTSRVLVPNPPEFRWMAQGTESPWFPGCPVYRQNKDGDWREAHAALAADLSAALAADGGPALLSGRVSAVGGAA